jgi:hypothetical protein
MPFLGCKMGAEVSHVSLTDIKETGFLEIQNFFCFRSVISGEYVRLLLHQEAFDTKSCRLSSMINGTAATQ